MALVLTKTGYPVLLDDSLAVPSTDLRLFFVDFVIVLLKRTGCGSVERFATDSTVDSGDLARRDWSVFNHHVLLLDLVDEALREHRSHAACVRTCLGTRPFYIHEVLILRESIVRVGVVGYHVLEGGDVTKVFSA